MSAKLYNNIFNKTGNNLQVADCLKDIPWIKHIHHIAELALPFITIYKPQFSKSLSSGLRGFNITQQTLNLALFKKAPSKTKSQLSYIQEDIYRLIKNLSELGSSYFARRDWVAFNAIIDLFENIQDLYKSPSDKKVEKFGQCIVTILQLTSLFNKNSLQLAITSLLAQAIINFYQMCIAAKEVYQAGTPIHEKTLDVIAKGLFSLIRARQGFQYLTLHCLLKVKQTEKQEPIKPALGKLSETMAKTRTILTNPINGEKYDLGAWFHGYGKGIVKWGNICFYKKTLADGTTETTLSCKINNLYWDRITQITASLNALTEEERKSLAPFLGCNNLEVYPLKALLWGGAKKDELYQVDLGSYHLENLGSLDIGVVPFEDRPNVLNKHITVSLKGDQEVESFQKILSVFGLGDILEPFSADDLKRMKLGFLFKTFFPQESDLLQKEQEYFDLPPQVLKLKMQFLAPQMSDYFTKYPVNLSEILPGYVRPSIPLAQSAQALTVKALTALYHGSNDRASPDSSNKLDEKNLSIVGNIVQNGLFSSTLRLKALMSTDGCYTYRRNGAMGTIFTQIIWEQDVKAHKKLADFGYSSGNVRFYFSPTALNRGSYQYTDDLYGTKEGVDYQNRKNILNFTRSFPLNNNYALACHEVCLPDRLLPNEIRAISVSTPEIQTQLVTAFRQAGMVYTDAQGIERLQTNNIPLDDFILTKPYVDEDTVKNCGPDIH